MVNKIKIYTDNKLLTMKTMLMLILNHLENEQKCLKTIKV